MKEFELITTSDLTPKILIFLQDAIKKHPYFAKNYTEAVCIILEEIGELAQSINDGDMDNARIELFHCLSTLIRLYGMMLHYDMAVENTKKELQEGRCG